MLAKVKALGIKFMVMLSLALVGVVSFAQEGGGPASYTDYGPVVDTAVFADLGTYIFGLLTLATLAGLGLLVARVGVKRIWTFIRQMF